MNAYFPVVNEHISKRNKKVCCSFRSMNGDAEACRSSWITMQHEAV